MRQFVLAIAVILGGCAEMSESQRQAEEAKNIVPINYKSDLVAFMRTYLNNPSNLRSAELSQPELRMVGSLTRYVSCVRYDAKGSNGQYAGIKENAVVFVSGKLDRVIELGGGEAGRDKLLRESCAGAVYQKFPELERLTR
jgi:hypothetical protein